MSDHEFQLKVVERLGRIEERLTANGRVLEAHTQQDNENFGALHAQVSRLVVSEAVARASAVKWGAGVSALIVLIAEVAKRVMP